MSTKMRSAFYLICIDGELKSMTDDLWQNLTSFCFNLTKKDVLLLGSNISFFRPYMKLTRVFLKDFLKSQLDVRFRINNLDRSFFSWKHFRKFNIIDISAPDLNNCLVQRDGSSESDKWVPARLSHF